MTEQTGIHLKRVYDEPESGEGLRVLVDRLWPRGLSKAKAAVDEWPKEIAPSPELRRWWDHDPDRFAEFAAIYRTELQDSTAVEGLLSILAEHSTVTLVFAAKDPAINHAVVLKEFLDSRG